MNNNLRTPYYFGVKHFNDKYLNMGYNYRNNLFKKTISPDLYSNPNTADQINTFESMLIFLIEETKTIKKMFSIAHDKNSVNIN